MKTKLLGVLAAAASMVFFGCDKNKEEDKAALTFRQDQEFNFTFEAEETRTDIRFDADEIWVVNTDAAAGADVSWFRLSPEYGQPGSAIVTLTVDENAEGTEDRSGVFKIMAGKTEQIFTVTQYARNSAKSDYVYMADENFRTYCLQNFDADGDGRLSKTEAAAVKEINCEEWEVGSLDGIQFMTSLETLNCRYNSITGDVDLSGLKNLKTVVADHNFYSSLNLNGCSALETLTANDNCGYDENVDFVFSMTDIDLGGCSALKYLKLQDNALLSLDLRDCVSLEEMDASYNSIRYLDISKCSKLRLASIRTNDLTSSVDFSHCPELTYLGAWEAGLTGLNVSGCSKLVQLIAYRNPDLKSIDVSGCPALTELNLYETGITSIDVKNNVNLTKLNLGYTGGLTSVDVSACTKLQELNLQENKLKTLDVSACHDLQILKAEQNELTSVNLSGCTALSRLYLYSNLLTDIDLSTNKSLTSIAIYENLLRTLDVTPCAQTLLILDCKQNNLETLKIGDMPLLNSLDASLNKLTSLDLRGCPSMEEALLSKNSLYDLKVKGLANMTTCEFQNNELERLDLRGCSALDELHLSNNKLNYISFYECTALRYVDILSNNVTSLDFSNNEKMAFLFATSDPYLKTIYIREGANYSTLDYDETVTTVYQKAPSEYDNVGGEHWGDEDVDPWKK